MPDIFTGPVVEFERSNSEMLHKEYDHYISMGDPDPMSYAEFVFEVYVEVA